MLTLNLLSKANTLDLFNSLWYELRMQRSGDKRIPLSVRDRVPRAVKLHDDMYHNLSAGNLSVLERICCEGLVGKLRNQIERRRRPPASLVSPEWVLERYNGLPAIPPTISVEDRWLRRIFSYQFPLSALWAYLAPGGVWAKVVSDRAVTVPIAAGALLRQVVVRIRSHQRMYYAKMINEGSGAWQREVKVQDLTEYVVIQKMIVEGREAEVPWKIWGTVQEADEKAVEELLSKGWSGTEGAAKQKTLSALDRIKATMM